MAGWQFPAQETVKDRNCEHLLVCNAVGAKQALRLKRLVGRLAGDVCLLRKERSTRRRLSCFKEVGRLWISEESKGPGGTLSGVDGSATLGEGGVGVRGPAAVGARISGHKEVLQLPYNADVEKSSLLCDLEL